MTARHLMPRASYSLLGPSVKQRALVSDSSRFMMLLEKFCTRPLCICSYSVSKSAILRLTQNNLFLFYINFPFHTAGVLIPFIILKHWYFWKYRILVISEEAFLPFSWSYSLNFSDGLISIFIRDVIYSSSVVLHGWVWLRLGRPIYYCWLSFSNSVI